MPYDLASVERGYGECVAEYNGHQILLRYRNDLDGRAMHAMARALKGFHVQGQPQTVRIPDLDLVLAELQRVLLPSGPNVPEDERGWDVTRDGESVPITEEELMKLPFDLPAGLLARVMGDANDPNRRKPSLGGSKVRASFQATASPTGTDSSRTPSGSGSTPPTSATHTYTTAPLAASSEPVETNHAAGYAGALG